MGRIFLLLCDQRKWCRVQKDCGTICKHTTNLQHAKNEFPKDVEEMEARFICYGKYNGADLFWEVDKDVSEHSDSD